MHSLKGLAVTYVSFGQFPAFVFVVAVRPFDSLYSRKRAVWNIYACRDTDAHAYCRSARYAVVCTGCIKKVDNFETALSLAKRLEVWSF